MKIEFSIKSNGFWENNIEKTENFISKYKEKLCMLSFSYDEFHKEFIELGYIKNIIDVARKYSVSTEIVGCFLKNGMQPSDVMNELGEYVYFTEFLYQPVIKTGSAKSIADESFIKLINADEVPLVCLIPRDKQILITPELKVFPCCSQVIENTILDIGDLHTEELSEVIEKIYTNTILNDMLLNGFKNFIALLKKYDIDYPKHLSTPCEFCEFLFKNDNMLRIMNEQRNS